MAMEKHVTLLGVLNLVCGGLGLTMGILVFGILGGVATLIGVAGVANQEEEALIAVPILGLVGIIISGFILLMSLPSFVLGYGLLKTRAWAEIVGLIVSALNLLSFPFGTALGIYGIWVLLQDETKRLLRAG